MSPGGRPWPPSRVWAGGQALSSKVGLLQLPEGYSFTQCQLSSVVISCPHTSKRPPIMGVGKDPLPATVLGREGMVQKDLRTRVTLLAPWRMGQDECEAPPPRDGRPICTSRDCPLAKATKLQDEAISAVKVQLLVLVSSPWWCAVKDGLAQVKARRAPS